MATASGYNGTAKSLHWLIVALLIGQFIFAWTMAGTMAIVWEGVIAELFRTGADLEINWLTTLARRTRTFRTKIPTSGGDDRSRGSRP